MPDDDDFEFKVQQAVEAGIDPDAAREVLEDEKQFPEKARIRFPATEVKLSGTDSNIFALMGQVQAALRRDGHGDCEAEFARDIMESGSYPEALSRIQNWVNVH